MITLIVNMGILVGILLICEFGMELFGKIWKHFKSALLYSVLCISDVFKEDFLICIVNSINKDYPIIKNSRLLTYIKCAMEIQNSCLHYENPIYACLNCYFCNLLYACITKRFHLIDVFIIQASFASIYCIGMRKRCTGKINFTEMLENNITRLKILFLPIEILKTILVFTSKNVIPIILPFSTCVIAKIHIDTAMLVQWIGNYGWIVSLWMVMVALYVLTLPMPVIAYYILKTMNFIERHKTSLCEVMTKK